MAQREVCELRPMSATRNYSMHFFAGCKFNQLLSGTGSISLS